MITFGSKRSINIVEKVLIVDLEEIAAVENFLLATQHFLVRWRQSHPRNSLSDVILCMLEFLTAHKSCLLMLVLFRKAGFDVATALRMRNCMAHVL